MINSSGGTSVSSLKSIIRGQNRFDNRGDIGFGVLLVIMLVMVVCGASVEMKTH